MIHVNTITRHAFTVFALQDTTSAVLAQNFFSLVIDRRATKGCPRLLCEAKKRLAGLTLSLYPLLRGLPFYLRSMFILRLIHLICNPYRFTFAEKLTVFHTAPFSILMTGLTSKSCFMVTVSIRSFRYGLGIVIQVIISNRKCCLIQICKIFHIIKSLWVFFA